MKIIFSLLVLLIFSGNAYCKDPFFAQPIPPLKGETYFIEDLPKKKCRWELINIQPSWDTFYLSGITIENRGKLLDHYLENDWEPFAVENGAIWLRRRVCE